MSVRIAVIGAGNMGADHAQIIASELADAELRLICDSDLSRAKNVAEECGAADAVSDPGSAFAREDVDAVVIASPDFTHTPLTLDALKAGKPVLCEKPLSQNSDECLQVIAAEKDLGQRQVMLGFMRRFDRAYTEMRQALHQGSLGRALMMHNFHRNVQTPNADFTGAMAITNSAPHEFDVARYVLDTEYRSISAFQPVRTDDLVAPVMMVLETADQQIVNIEINNNAAYGYDVRAELVGEAASISMNPVMFTRIDSSLSSSTRYDEDWRARYHTAYVRQNRVFVEFVNTGMFPEAAADCWDGYCSTRVAEAGVEALKSGMRQTVHMIEKPDIYRSPKGSSA